MYSVKKMQRCGKQKIEEIFVDVGRDELSLRKRPGASRCQKTFKEKLRNLIH